MKLFFRHQSRHPTVAIGLFLTRPCKASFLCAAIPLLFFLCPIVHGAAPVSFSKEIAPIFQQKCVACHGPEKIKGGFQLHTFEALLKGGESKAPSVSPGQPARSKLFELLTTKDPDDRMPQKDDPLAPAQIALVERWIREGAIFDGADPRLPLSALVPPEAQPEPPRAYSRPVPILALAFDPGGRELAVGGYHEITIWDPADGKLLRRITNVAQRTHSLAYSPDGRMLAAAGGSPGRLGEVKLFDPRNGALRRTLATTADSMLAVCISPDGSRLGAGGADNSIRVFDVATGQQRLVIEQHADWVLALAFSPNGAQIASASRDKSARLFDVNTGELETTYLGHGDAVMAVAFGAEGKQIFTAGRDKRIHVWSPRDAKKISDVGGFDGEILQLAAHEDQLFSACADRTVRQHTVSGKTIEKVRHYSGHADFVYALSYHAPTRRLASGSFDGEVRLWSVESGQLLQSFIAAPGVQQAVKKL